MASAADAPQMATAPADNTLRADVRPRRRPSQNPNDSVLSTASTTTAALGQPNAATWLAVMRAPSRPTPSRSTWRAPNSTPGRVRGAIAMKFSATPKNRA